MPYDVDDLLADVGSGHRVERTVFMECHAAYRTDGPAELRAGRRDRVRRRAAATQSGGLIAGIVGHADLRLPNLDDDPRRARRSGPTDSSAASATRCRRAEPSDGLMIAGGAPAGLFEDPAFRAGVARLGARGLTYDTLALPLPEPRVPRTRARRARHPDGARPLRHADRRRAVTPTSATRSSRRGSATSPRSPAARTSSPSSAGMAMPDNGYGWHARRATADLGRVRRRAGPLLPAT